MARALAWLGLVWAVACGDAGGSPRDDAPDGGGANEPGPLSDPALWTELPADADPLASHRPELVDCPAGARFEEAGALEIQTGYCNYAALMQPLLRDVASGDTVRLLLLHDRLVFDAPAEAHVALLLDGQVVWERTVAIPAEAESFDEQFVAPVSAAAGAPLVLHLHNHGYNAWKLMALQTL